MGDGGLNVKLSRLKRRLLAADAWIDSSIYELWYRLFSGWEGVRIAFDRFRFRGWKRGFFELASESFTWVVIGAGLMLALAQPAFRVETDDFLAKADLAVTFLDRNGNEIGKRGILQSDAVPLDELPDHLINATLATEDRRFWNHFGIDVPGTFRALMENARANGVVQGGSSITQQLAKNLFLTNERTLERKIKELFLAFWLETNLTKREILKLYLDRAYLGGGAFGVEAASQYYFGKSARDVTLAEAAMLAGMFKAPTKYAPHVDIAASRARANQVLSNMVDGGFMTEGQVHAARINPATPVARARGASPDYFLDWAFSEVERMAKEGAFGSERTLVIRTALDSGLQSHAEASVESILRQYGTQYGVGQAAAVVMEPSGLVRAMVGGRDYSVSQFNRATAAMRQPGSSFKTFVYTAAFMNGYEPSTIIVDAPITLGRWSPQNYGRSYAGRVTLTTALTKSINTVPVRLAQAVGRDKVMALAQSMGIRTPLRPIQAIALGVSEVTVMDMASGYGTLANNGRLNVPHTVLEAWTARGERVWRYDAESQQTPQIVPAKTVSQINGILVNVTENGTGRRAQLPRGFRVAGKTGTSQSYRDAWFVGFTGDFVGAVWFGNDNFTATKEMTGGSLPAMTWKEIMTFAHRDIEAPTPIAGVSDQPTSSGAAIARVEADLGPLRGAALSRGSVDVLRDVSNRMRTALSQQVSELDLGGGVSSAQLMGGTSAPVNASQQRP
ncbi:penicillin-binding protein [Agaricicola taiwanensis]|uniref:Penicillin-binding protein n=1 Tax=Agaricicola taiwanensis TaxID=591372 RepID=A0A8J2VLR8_9RHOB|nr:PBP1A family penicillin-binding protein [Agaricicola taiwanensis]GGE36966.1 penicillin-binding protein [Agaricicola taiwanensis]